MRFRGNVGFGFVCALCLGAGALAAAQVADFGRDGIGLTVDADRDRVDPARDFTVTVTLSVPAGKSVAMPDLRDRFAGFRIAEDFTADPVTAADGTVTTVSNWRLVPEPEAPRYRLAPFAVGDLFYTKPIVFPAVERTQVVSGGMEVHPKRDLPPLSWKLVGEIAGALLALGLVAAGLRWLVKTVRTAVKVHRMSPVERAFWDLDELVRRNLPGRGFFKVFYIELTMVVRRYVERQYGVKAPNMTTQEFLASFGGAAELKSFLEAADLVKFAGVKATVQMTDAATERAREYLRTTDAAVRNKKAADGSKADAGAGAVR